jgi:hypothetical protein
MMYSRPSHAQFAAIGTSVGATVGLAAISIIEAAEWDRADARISRAWAAADDAWAEADAARARADAAEREAWAAARATDRLLAELLR